MRIIDSARTHGVLDEDIRHASDNAIRAHDLGDGFVMLVGPALDGSLLEVGVVVDGNPRIVHAMPARAKFL